MLKIEGQLFSVGDVTVSPGAQVACMRLQKREDQAAVHVHCSILIKLHATGEGWKENIGRNDRIANRRAVAQSTGRVISLIGKMPNRFVIITDMETEKTLITTPDEV